MCSFSCLVINFLHKWESLVTSSKKAGILCQSHCRAQIKSFSWPPVSGLLISSRPAICLGSSKVLFTEILRSHQFTCVVYKMHLSGCNLRFCRLQNANSQRKPRKNFSTLSLYNKTSSSQIRSWSRSLSSSSEVTVDCKRMTVFVVPCRTRVGLKMTSGLMKLWHSRASGASESC